MKKIIVNGKNITPIPFTLTINNKKFTIKNLGTKIIINGETYFRNSSAICYGNGYKLEIENYKIFIDNEEINLNDENINLVGNGFVNRVTIDEKDYTIEDVGDKFLVNGEIFSKNVYQSFYGKMGHITCENGRLVINDEPISFNAKLNNYDDYYSEEICDD